MQTIFLTGFMGAGKTTIGQLLADKLNCPVMDTDALIEKQEGKAITTIFSEHGEAYFRNLETNMLHSFGEEAGVVTTGGGIVIKENNRQLMKERGTVIYLNSEFSEIWNRLIDDESRPLIQHKNKERTQSLFNQRLPFYKDSADVMIETSGKTAEQTAEEIIERLNLKKCGKANTVN
ncbi:shikimate kinase [Bacillus ectoiniformans]|uniref:shikimate kinase n=1 Tax=Bacillus ectoiniformans TaxID=1494429 RepID=UPI001956F687|nr:shikimate kinase [Bacillus ectoiniformans]MBM7650461.1 shikimate kinase [Bacillus ectoiniformans]